MDFDHVLRSVITSLLTQFPKLFSEVKSPEPALLPILDAAMSALAATGGKIVCSLSTLPTWGPGRLFRRDDGKLHGIESEKKLFQTEHPGWRRTADKMVEYGVGVDFFIAAPGGVYMDIATIGMILESTRVCGDPSLTNRRAHFRAHRWRSFPLSEFPCTTRQSEALVRSQALRDSRNRLPSVDESALLERLASVVVSWKFQTTHIWSRS